MKIGPLDRESRPFALLKPRQAAGTIFAMSTTTDERLIEQMASALEESAKRLESLDEHAYDMSDALKAIAISVEGIRASAATASD